MSYEVRTGVFNGGDKPSQEGALKLYTEQIWPDMVGRHQPSSGASSRRGEAPTVHAQAAKHLGKRLVDIAGSDGSKMKRSNLG